MKEELKVLILEDNNSDAGLVIRELSKSELNCRTEIVQNQKEFKKALASFKPDIILSDYSLPSFDGLTAFHIKQKSCPDIPFIIVSGSLGEENAVELIKTGVDDYAMKDKLFTLIPKITRALKDAAKMKEKRMVDEKFKIQNEKLFEIAFLQSHQVRRPIASLLGLISLCKFDDPGNPLNGEVLSRIEVAARELDTVILEIVKKTAEVKEMR